MKRLLLVAILLLSACGDSPPMPKPPYLAHLVGSSMLPTLQPDRLYMVMPLAYADLKPGMIAVSRTRDNWNDVAHRVTTVKPDYYITKGDNNMGYDDPIHAKSFIGIIVLPPKK